jgi:Fe-S-cluster containining protein
MKRRPLPVVSCTDCGACCTGQAALPIHLVGQHFAMPGVAPLPVDLAEELRATIERFDREGWPPDGSPCIWYDADRRQCRHYEYRPTLCRDNLAVGDEACRRWRKTVGIDPSERWVMRRGRMVRTVRGGG